MGILKDERVFEVYVVSDCWAITDFYSYQVFSNYAAEAASIAVKTGTDLNCGCSCPHLAEAYKKGLITEDELDVAVKRLFTALFVNLSVLNFEFSFLSSNSV